jgi:hypothetical protein
MKIILSFNHAIKLKLELEKKIFYFILTKEFFKLKIKLLKF